MEKEFDSEFLARPGLVGQGLKSIVKDSMTKIN